MKYDDSGGVVSEPDYFAMASSLVTFLMEVWKNKSNIDAPLVKMLNALAHEVFMIQQQGDEISLMSMKGSVPQKDWQVTQVQQGTSACTTQRIIQQATSSITELTKDLLD